MWEITACYLIANFSFDINTLQQISIFFTQADEILLKHSAFKLYYLCKQELDRCVPDTAT